MATQVATILDLSHNNEDVDFGEAKAIGIIGVILKASQGRGFKDPTFLSRAARVLEEGLALAAYHFGDDSPAEEQVSNFQAAIQGAGIVPHVDERAFGLEEARE